MDLVIHSSPLNRRLQLTRLPVKTRAPRTMPLPQTARQPVQPMTIRVTLLPLMTSVLLRIGMTVALSAILWKCPTSLVLHMHPTRLRLWDRRPAHSHRQRMMTSALHPPPLTTRLAWTLAQHLLWWTVSPTSSLHECEHACPLSTLKRVNAFLPRVTQPTKPNCVFVPPQRHFANPSTRTPLILRTKT